MAKQISEPTLLFKRCILIKFLFEKVSEHNQELERAVDGAPLQILTLKFLTPPAPPSPTPGALFQHQNENSVQFVFYLLFVRTHTKFGIKNEIDMVTEI